MCEYTFQYKTLKPQLRQHKRWGRVILGNLQIKFPDSFQTTNTQLKGSIHTLTG